MAGSSPIGCPLERIHPTLVDAAGWRRADSHEAIDSGPESPVSCDPGVPKIPSMRLCLERAIGRPGAAALAGTATPTAKGFEERSVLRVCTQFCCNRNVLPHDDVGIFSGVGRCADFRARNDNLALALAFRRAGLPALQGCRAATSAWLTVCKYCYCAASLTRTRAAAGLPAISAVGFPLFSNAWAISQSKHTRRTRTQLPWSISKVRAHARISKRSLVHLLDYALTLHARHTKSCGELLRVHASKRESGIGCRQIVIIFAASCCARERLLHLPHLFHRADPLLFPREYGSLTAACFKGLRLQFHRYRAE